MYAQYYNLTKMPFEMIPDPEFHFPSDLHREAIAAVVYGLKNNKGIVTLIGEVGTGKTLTLRTLVNHSLLDEFKVINFNNPKITPSDLTRNLLEALNVEFQADQSTNEKFDLLIAECIRFLRDNEGLLIVIDEAQHLPDETLEYLRLLTNIESENAKRIQILLSGQPELLQKLKQPHLRQLRQRIGVSARLKAMTYEQTERYIAYRMWMAGAEQLPFYSDAFRQIIQVTRGNPRLVNTVCDLCLVNAMGYDKKWVDLDIVNEVIEDLKDTVLAGLERGQSLIDRRNVKDKNVI